MKLLIIEDSEKIRRALTTGLRKLGHVVDAAADGCTGYDFARYTEYDVILLDLMLPEMDGLSVLKKLRKLGIQTHILILSARDQTRDKIEGLQLGADDYLIKPFSFDELHARLVALARRKYGHKNPTEKIGPIALNTADRQVFREGSPLDLTPGEYALFELLALNRGQIFSKEYILDKLHDSDSYPTPNTVEVLVCNLRKKIGRQDHAPIIKTRRGYGYLIE